MGGLLVGYEVSRHLEVQNMFCERVDGEFQLRRGFGLDKGDRVVIIEDVVTTGKSSMEVVDYIRECGGEVVAIASLINRSGKEDVFEDIPYIMLANVYAQTYSPDEVPEELASIPVSKPGSRFLKSG